MQKSEICLQIFYSFWFLSAKNNSVKKIIINFYLIIELLEFYGNLIF